MKVRIGFLGLFAFLSFTQAQETNVSSFRLGIDVLAERGFRDLKGKSVGLVTNPCGVDGIGVPTWLRRREAEGVNFVACCGTDHGVFGPVGVGAKVCGG